MNSNQLESTRINSNQLELTLTGHAVRSLDVSVSVNVFYSTLADLATRGAHRALTDFAHNRLGLWRANCVCHRPSGSMGMRP